MSRRLMRNIIISLLLGRKLGKCGNFGFNEHCAQPDDFDELKNHLLRSEWSGLVNKLDTIQWWIAKLRDVTGTVLVTNQVLENMKKLNFFHSNWKFCQCQNLNFESDEVVGWHVGSLGREAMQGVGALRDSYTSRYNRYKTRLSENFAIEKFRD